MKKTFCILLAAVLMLSALSGCYFTETNTSPEKPTSKSTISAETSKTAETSEAKDPTNKPSSGGLLEVTVTSPEKETVPTTE